MVSCIEISSLEYFQSTCMHFVLKQKLLNIMGVYFTSKIDIQRPCWQSKGDLHSVMYQ